MSGRLSSISDNLIFNFYTIHILIFMHFFLFLESFIFNFIVPADPFAVRGLNTRRFRAPLLGLVAYDLRRLGLSARPAILSFWAYLADFAEVQVTSV